MLVLVIHLCLTVCNPVNCSPPVFCPWNFPGQNTGMGNHSLLQWVFPTQGSNPDLPHCRQILYHLSHRWGMLIMGKARHAWWRRQWHSTPVLLPEKSHGWRSLVGCSPRGGLRVGHDWATSFSLFTFTHWRRKWQPTPVFLPGESQGRGSLVGCRIWGRTESDTTEAT